LKPTVSLALAPPGPAPSRPPGAPAAPADSKPASGQPQPPAQSASGAPPSVTPPAGAPVTPRTPTKDDEFIPTEELGADEEATFPVDI
jgi:hypothetical protein